MAKTYREKIKAYLKGHIYENRTLFENNPDGIFVLDRDGLFALINRPFEDMIGYPAHTMYDLKFTDFFQDERVQINQFLAKALNGEVRNFDTYFRHFNGKKVHVNLTFIPISINDEIIGMYGVSKDITDLKNRQLELKKAHEIHNFITENSLDIITKTEINGTLGYLSIACKNILGYKPEELIGRFSGEFIHEDDVEELTTKFRSIIKGNNTDSLLFRARHKCGHYIWMEAHSSPLINSETGKTEAVLSVIRDINERVTKEETYKSIIRHSPDAIFITNDKDILFFNHQCLELLDAKSKNEIIKRGLVSFIATEDLSNIKHHFQTAKQDHITDFLEVTIYTLTGRKKRIEVKVIPTTYQNEPAKHIIMRDITDRIQTQKMLLNSEKLTVAGQLAAGIAHEVRNPLTSIRGFIQLMEKISGGNSEYYGIIYREIDRINQILSELLTLAKPQDTHFKKQDLYSLLDQVKILLGTQAIMNNIIIELDFPSEQSIIINCDENQLKQVFINFIKNSIEAMPNGGKITIRAIHDENFAKISFIDQGLGIPKELLDRIGEPFFTTKNKGTGLGLMISKQIIDNHEGQFKLRSSKKGTTIEVRLPLDVHN